jgi:hypothetical protein
VRPNIAKSARTTGDFIMEIQVRGDALVFSETGLRVKRQCSGRGKYHGVQGTQPRVQMGDQKWMVKEAMKEVNVELKGENTWGLRVRSWVVKDRQSTAGFLPMHKGNRGCDNHNLKRVRSDVVGRVRRKS